MKGGRQITDDGRQMTDDVAGPVMLNGAAARFRSGGFDFRGEDVKARAILPKVQ